MDLKNKGQAEHLAKSSKNMQDKDKQNVVTIPEGHSFSSNKFPEGNISQEELEQDIFSDKQPASPSYCPEKALNAFPLQVLPLKAQELAKGAEEALGTPLDILASTMLFAAAAAAGNTVSLEVKKGKTEKAVIFLAQIGQPNSNKSGAVKFPLKPLNKRDKENHQEYTRQKSTWEAEQAKPSNEREELDKPIFPRVVISDATQEALAGALQDSPRGILLFRDELAGWLKDFNRYKPGSDMENFLSIWSLGPFSIDRKTSEPIRLENAFLSVIGTIQPGVLEELGKKERSVNGFIDRFLFCYPEGLEKPLWSEKEIDLYLVQDYETAINKLLDLQFNKEGKGYVLTLEPEARKLLFQFFNTDNKPLCDRTESELLKGMYGKFDIHTIRLAIAIHLIHWAYSSQEELLPAIKAQTVTQAIRVAKYFRLQTLKVYNALNEATPLDKLSTDKQKVYEALPEEFTTKEGTEIAKGLGMPDRTFREFLRTQKGKLFEQVEHGKHRKIF